uniref:Protein FAM92A1 n=2 Tax=Lygus hesperus TaxID=30085 RepID=A0A0A9YIY6_LYGHE
MKTSKVGEDFSLGQQAKFVEDRFSATEETMSKLCSSFSIFTKRTAKYRDANDQLAAAFNDYASKEQINKTLKVCLENLAQLLACLGDHRDNSTLFLEEQVMTSLTQYATRCKNYNSEIKNIYCAKEKELCKRRQLTKIRQRLPQNFKVIMKAEGELVDACSKVSKLQGSLEEYALSFERSKLTDLKRILHDFLRAELSFHIGAVESFSKALADVDNINIDVDFQAFKNVLVRPNMAIRLDIVRGSKQLGRQDNIDRGIPNSVEEPSHGLISVEGHSSKADLTTDVSEMTMALEKETITSDEESEGEVSSENDSTIHVKPSPRT